MVEGPERLDFSFDSYRHSLLAYRDAGYKISGFEDFLDAPGDKHMILRHDIDHSLEQARKIAEIDTEAGASSTFFLRVHARQYNLFSLPSLQIIAEIEELGHDVELHLEGGMDQWLQGDEREWRGRQKQAFEAAVGREIRGFSSHEPARTGGIELADELLEEWGPAVRYHAYQSRFLNPRMKYLSDSSGRWREGHFGGWVGREPVMQILTHPYWWYEKTPAENY